MQLFQTKGPAKYQSEEEKRLHRCCFTGHRPEKLLRFESDIKKEFTEEINQAVHDGMNVFITGMACGVDLWAAEIVLDLRQLNKDIKLICAVPYEGFDQRWNKSWQLLYRRVLCEADLVRVISRGYFSGVFQVRNEWMVNHSARVIAVFSGRPGGTRNTIDYAKRKGIPVRIIKG